MKKITTMIAVGFLIYWLLLGDLTLRIERPTACYLFKYQGIVWTILYATNDLPDHAYFIKIS